MPTYLDVAAVRIQSYIARTPALRLRRGASRLLTTTTSAAAVSAWLADAGLPVDALNEDAGEADGVISLIVAPGSEQRVAQTAMLWMREHLPSVELQAVWATAGSYLEAYPLLAAQRSRPLVALPQFADFSLGETCAECRVDLRSAGELCADCRARDTAGRRTTSRGSQAEPSEASATEQDLLHAVTRSTNAKLRPVRHFGDLAQAGEGTGNRNHVATVAMDGNGMGAFFSVLAGTGDVDVKRRISPAISAATRSALHTATLGIIQPDDRWLPVVPHVLGGDDVVVSVVADRAWDFTHEFLDAFSRELTRTGTELGLPPEVLSQIPSMSAGLVFAHVKFPYARAVHLAEQMLRRAKQDTAGAEAALCWLDVTDDGEALPSWRRAFTQRELAERTDALGELAGLGNTALQVLRRLLASGTDEEATAAVLSWARRNNHPGIQPLLTGLPLDDLRGLAALTRWWRP
ncbi:MAG: hypothetical protein ABIS86_09685 [Streptosporangiaceae bacterium]